jgi:aminopeptidase YwaD
MRVLVVAVIACAAIVACGGDDSPTPTASPRPSPSATPSLAPTPSPSPALDLGEAEFSAERALEHTRVLAQDIGSRVAGSEDELAAAEYIRDELASYGYEAAMQPFPVAFYKGDVSEIRATYAGGVMTFEGQPLTGSPSGTADAGVAHAGLGRAGDFPAGTAGNVALIERGEITFTEKAQNAESAGAAAVIIYNNEPGPFIAQMAPVVTIPVVAMTQEDGDALLGLMAGNAVTVALEVSTELQEVESRNVIAKPAGEECRIVVGGHYDTVAAGPGANDNGSGTGVVIELARALAADGLDEPVCFALFGAEEAGLVGSIYYVDNLSGAENDALQAMLNFDMLGVGEGWPLLGTTGMVDLAGEVAEGLGIPYRISSPDGFGGSDHAPFIDAGIPALLFNCFCDPNYHTAGDRFEFLLSERIAQAGALGMGVLEALLAA